MEEDIKNKPRFITFIYKDGTKASVQHCDLYDGEWQYGDLTEKIIYKDFNFPYYNDNK